MNKTKLNYLKSTNGIFKGKVSALAPDGSGIVIHDDNKYFVPGALPGETIVCRCTGGNSALLLEVITPSEKRRAPLCPAFGLCGSCALQHIQYEEQVAEKIKLLKNTFGKHGITVPQIQTISGGEYSYRERVQFHKNYNSSANNSFGFMARASNTIVPVTECPVISSTIQEALRRQKIITPIDKDRWNVYGRQGVFLNEADPPHDTGIVKICGRDITVCAAHFFQSNGAMLEKLISKIISLANDCAGKNTALDLYSGSGVFSLFLGSVFENITLLEQSKSLINLAKTNLRNARLTSRAAFCDASDTAWAQKALKAALRFDFILADPGRQGLTPVLKKYLAAYKPEIFCYVSCSYRALARDVRDLVRAGFHLDSLEIYDFYPQTMHIESLAVFY